VDKVREDEAKFNTQSETYKAEIEDLRKKLAEANENFAVAKASQEISEWSKTRLEKNVEELRESKERCFEKSLDCVKKLKTSFAKVGAYSSEENFIRGDPEGVIDWISGEAEAFEEILTDRGDICAFSGAQGIASILEKAGCDHVKAAAQAETAFSIDDTKDPSAKATLVGGKFYSDVWVNSGRELANEIIKKNEKETHEARAFFWLRTNSLLITAELSPVPEPYNPLADPVIKEALDIMSIANSIVDEVVDKLLNEATEKILKED
jgi:cell division septum initiation protein DivIVA